MATKAFYVGLMFDGTREDLIAKLKTLTLEFECGLYEREGAYVNTDSLCCDYEETDNPTPFLANWMKPEIL